MLQCGPISSPQENANRAWCRLGDELGFDGMSVEPILGRESRFFTAIAKATACPEKAPEASHEPKWHIDGTLIYQLVHAGWRKGEELTENRLWVSVQGNIGVPKEEAEALAQRIADFLNAAA